MQSPDLETVESVRATLQKLISAREPGVLAVPYFPPTDIGGLPHDVQARELNVKEDTDHGNRVRAGIHMTLSAAVTSLEVAEALLKDFVMNPNDRKRELVRCSLNARVARDAAAEAAAVLSGQKAPKSDAMVEIKRLKMALLQRFGFGD